jgi:hypothetical protein
LGQAFVFRGQEVIHANLQLPLEGVDSAAAMYMDDEPCIVIAGKGKRAGV